MTGRLAHALCDLASLVLPRRRKLWGDAMRAELDHIGDGRSAVAHATGCLVAAARERALDFETRFAAGLWSVALVTGAFALFHIGCAARGVRVLLGARDGFLDMLVRGGADMQLLASYQGARPVVISCLLGLGLAQLAAAWFLFRMQLRPFLFAGGAALLIATVAVAIQLSIVPSAAGLPSEFFAPIAQGLALPMLLLWSNGRHRRPGRRA